ncbi:hypothetical protein D3C84_599750 [compost metagenome]
MQTGRDDFQPGTAGRGGTCRYRGGGQATRRERAGIGKTHFIAGTQQGRFSAVQVPHLQRRDADDLPPAGAGLRINTAEFPRQGNRTCGYAGAWSLSARHLETGTASEVGEARRESAEGHAVVMGGVAPDHLGAADPQQRGDLVEVFTIVVNGNVHPALLDRAAPAQVLVSDTIDERLPRNGAGAELDQQGACGRNDFFHARNGLRRQGVEQCQGLVQVVQFDEEGVQVDR